MKLEHFPTTHPLTLAKNCTRFLGFDSLRNKNLKVMMHEPIKVKQEPTKVQKSIWRGVIKKKRQTQKYRTRLMSLLIPMPPLHHWVSNHTKHESRVKSQEQEKESFPSCLQFSHTTQGHTLKPPPQCYGQNSHNKVRLQDFYSSQVMVWKIKPYHKAEENIFNNKP